jgi:hypothetical protein
MRSKHANARPLIQRGLYDILHSFTQLEQRISALGGENSKAVGDAFEIFVEGYLATHQKLQAEAIWLVGQVPQSIRQQMNLPNDAKGISDSDRRAGSLSSQAQVTASLPQLHGNSAIPSSLSDLASSKFLSL